MTTVAVTDYPDRGALAEGLADLLAGRLAEIVTSRGRASIAVPGGTTPGAMLTRLGAAALPWQRIAVTLTDERRVPPDSPRSNRRLLTETLLLGAAAACFQPLEDPSDGLEGLSAALEANVLPLDIAVLGMGADMHTASLFPGAGGLDEALAADAPAAVAIEAPGAAEPRITLSARVLAAAGERHIMIAGSDKRAALERALGTGDPRLAPILVALDGARVHYAE